MVDTWPRPERGKFCDRSSTDAAKIDILSHIFITGRRSVATLDPAQTQVVSWKPSSGDLSFELRAARRWSLHIGRNVLTVAVSSCVISYTRPRNDPPSLILCAEELLGSIASWWTRNCASFRDRSVLKRKSPQSIAIATSKLPWGKHSIHKRRNRVDDSSLGLIGKIASSQRMHNGDHLCDPPVSWCGMEVASYGTTLRVPNRDPQWARVWRTVIVVRELLFRNDFHAAARINWSIIDLPRMGTRLFVPNAETGVTWLMRGDVGSR